MASSPSKRLRKDSTATSSAPAVVPSGVDETHAVQLARHFTALHKNRLFTDLKVHSPHHLPSEPSVDPAATLS